MTSYDALHVNDRIFLTEGKFVVIAEVDNQLVLHPLSSRTALFRVFSQPELNKKFKTGEAYLSDSASPVLPVFVKTVTMLEKAQKNYELIQPLVTNNQLYLDIPRWKKVRRQLAAEDQARLRRINRLLIRYWRNGLSTDALIPRYGGNRGKKYIHHECKKNSVETNQDQEKLREFIKRRILCPGGISLRKGFKVFCQETVDSSLSEIRPPLTFRQFRYFYETEWSKTEREMLRSSFVPQQVS